MEKRKFLNVRVLNNNVVSESVNSLLIKFSMNNVNYVFWLSKKFTFKEHYNTRIGLLDNLKYTYYLESDLQQAYDSKQEYTIKIAGEISGTDLHEILKQNNATNFKFETKID